MAKYLFAEARYLEGKQIALTFGIEEKDIISARFMPLDNIAYIMARDMDEEANTTKYLNFPSKEISYGRYLDGEYKYLGFGIQVRALDSRDPPRMITDNAKLDHIAAVILVDGNGINYRNLPTTELSTEDYTSKRKRKTAVVIKSGLTAKNLDELARCISSKALVLDIIREEN